MVNIEQITSTLAKLPDQALQRYAMMHKDDPYIMSLAVSESKRRKEMRSAGQMQMQPQPKVVDQAVAEMGGMPEEQGIGALPVQMEFAEGGITGYAGGGEVERYQTGGLLASKYQQEMQELTTGARLQLSPDVEAYAKQVSAQEQAANQAAQAAYLKSEQQRMLQGPYGRTATVTTPSPVDPSFRRQQDPRMAGVSAVPAGQQLITSGIDTVADAANKAPGIDRLAPPPAPSAARAPAAPAMSIEDRFLAAQKKMTDQPNPFAAQETELQTEARKLAEERLAGVKAGQEQFKDAFKGREMRIEERAKELEKSKDTNTGLAFLEAGLAIMSTPGGLATAIGKGAREGTAKYAAGIDKLRSAQEKLDDAKDRMEELKLNRAEMSAKELREAELGIQQTVLAGKKDALSSAQKLYGDRSALSQKIVETTIGIEQKDKDRSAQAQLKSMPTYEQNLQKQYVQQWLKKPENAGKTELDAMVELGLLRSPGMERNPTPTDRLRAAQTMLENATTEAEANMARQEISQIMQGMRAAGGQSGVGAPPAGAVRLKQ